MVSIQVSVNEFRENPPGNPLQIPLKCLIIGVQNKKEEEIFFKEIKAGYCLVNP